MPVRPGETIDPEATRRRILDIAEQVFAAHGINAVGVNEIAEATSASKASIYKLFGTKQGLVEATIADRSRRAQAWLRRETATAAPGVPRVLAMFDLFREWYGVDDFHGCAIVNAAAEVRAAEGALTRLARSHLAGYRAFLLDELENAEVVADADLLVSQLLILIEGATVVAAIEREPGAATAARRVAEQLLLRDDERRTR